MININYPKPRNQIPPIKFHLGELDETHIGKNVSTPKKDRFLMIFRNGKKASYLYAQISLIELKGKTEILLHCNCSSLSMIVIKGFRLNTLAQDLINQTIGEIYESDRPDLEDDGEMTVQSIEMVNRAG